MFHGAAVRPRVGRRRYPTERPARHAFLTWGHGGGSLTRGQGTCALLGRRTWALPAML